MATLSTPALSQYILQKIRNRQPLVFDEIIFANIPGLTATNLTNHLRMPSNNQIVHRQAVSQVGYVNDNAVVYSVTLGTEVGNFNFNFIGLINRAENVLAVAVQTDTIQKIRNQNNQQGNSLTRSILLEFNGARQATNITIPAQTWQIDFTVRLHGLDEKIRLTNLDFYGDAIFFENGFLVRRGNQARQYSVQAGNAYIKGVRATTEGQTLTQSALPATLYVDVAHYATVTGAYETHTAITTARTSDYVDNSGYQHYVAPIARIEANGSVTDLRAVSNGFIPNHKKSSAVNSTSEDAVSTSLATKLAYDKATAAEQLAQTKQDALVRHRLDLTALDAGLYHLVTFFPTGAQMDGQRWTFQILRPLRGLGNVTWATHNSGGFSLQVGWSSNASAWGANGLYRVIDFLEYAFTPQSPIIGIGQNVNASIEYCYLRGGSVYFADAPAGFEVVVQTEAVTRNGITLAPSREFDARLMPVVDVKQAREVVPEAVRHKNLDSLIPSGTVRWDRAAPHELPIGTVVGLGRRSFLNLNDEQYTGWQLVSRAHEPSGSFRIGANNGRFFIQHAILPTQWGAVNEAVMKRELTTENLNSVEVVGLYQQVIATEATPARNYPEMSGGTLWVSPNGNGVLQEFITQNGIRYQRLKPNDRWQSWRRIDGTDWAEIRNRPLEVEASLSTRNLNEVTTVGLYGQTADANAITARNYPTRQAGSLLVTPSAHGVQQEYTTYHSNEKYVRGRTNGTWHDWRMVSGQDKVSKGGDTMTGTLVLPEIHVTKNNGGGKNIRIGDDAWIGDDAVGYGVKIKAQGDESKGFVAFGSSGLRLGRGLHYNAHEPFLEWEGNYFSLNARDGEYAGIDFIRRGNNGNFHMRIEALPDKSWKFWTEGSHEISLPIKSGTVALRGEVVALTGEITHGGTLPLPDGFNENECHFFISMKDDNPGNTVWDIDERGAHLHYKQECWLYERRKAHCRTHRLKHGVGGEWIGSHANYLVIGVKK